MAKRRTAATPKLFHSSYRPTPPPSRVAEKAPSRRAIFFVILLLLGIYLIGRLPVFQLQTIEVKGSASSDVSDTLSQLKGHSIFAKSVSQLPRQLLLSNLSLETLQCHRGIPNTLRCEANNRQPALAWKHADKQYLVDNSGLVYGEKQADLPGLLLVEDQGPGKVEVGTLVASDEIVKTYRHVAEKAKELNLTVGQLSINDSLYQFQISLSDHQKLSTPPSPASTLTVLMSATESIDNQYSSLIATIQQHGAAITQRVDLRIPGYAYYK